LFKTIPNYENFGTALQPVVNQERVLILIAVINDNSSYIVQYNYILDFKD